MTTYCISSFEFEERIEWYRSRTWDAGNLDDPRCESRGAYKLHGSTFVKPHCVLPAAHQGDHLGPDGAAWRGQTQSIKVRVRIDGDDRPSKMLGELGEYEED